MINELWAKIYIECEETRYSVSTYGRIRNDLTGKYLKSTPDKKGYHTVKLYHNGNKKTCKVHRLVMDSSITVRSNNQIQINHIDGDKNNNSSTNLEWVTCSENVKHAFDMKLKVAKKGNDHSNSIFTEDLVHKICTLLEKGHTGKEIKKTLKINNKYLISNIRRKKYWRHISDNYNF